MNERRKVKVIDEFEAWSIEGNFVEALEFLNNRLEKIPEECRSSATIFFYSEVVVVEYARQLTDEEVAEENRNKEKSAAEALEKDRATFEALKLKHGWS